MGGVLIVVYQSFSLAGFAGLLLHPSSYVWFVWSLFFIWLIFSVCLSLSEHFRINQYLAISATVLILLIVRAIIKEDVCNILSISNYYIFYAIGYVIKSKKWIPQKMMTIAITTVLWLIFARFRNSAALESLYSEIPLIPTKILMLMHNMFTSIFAIITLFSIFQRWFNEDKNGCHKFMLFCGSYSLGIYACHIVFMRQLIHGISEIAPTFVSLPLSFVLTVVITLLIVKIFSMDKSLSIVFLGKINK